MRAFTRCVRTGAWFTTRPLSLSFLATFAPPLQSSTLTSLKTLNMSKGYDDIIYHVILGGDTGLLMSADQYASVYLTHLTFCSHASF